MKPSFSPFQTVNHLKREVCVVDDVVIVGLKVYQHPDHHAWRPGSDVDLCDVDDITVPVTRAHVRRCLRKQLR